MENYVKQDTPQMTIRRTRTVCWIPKATNTHSEYVVLIIFPRQQWIHERASVSVSLKLNSDRQAQSAVTVRIFRHVTLYCLQDTHDSFGGTYRLHFQGWFILMLPLKTLINFHETEIMTTKNYFHNFTQCGRINYYE